VRRGVFGAPTMFVGQQMFFGQDRLEFVREALGRSGER
jgi:2-hydroxychromene-2-carboxylate isomerase